MIRARLMLAGIDEMEAAAEGLVRQNLVQMGRRRFPSLYSSGIRYKAETGEVWKPAGRLLADKLGDCEDLAAYRAAELRKSGRDPAARVGIVRSGRRVYHAIVERGDGSIEDPSKRLGMKTRGQRTVGQMFSFAPAATAPTSPAAVAPPLPPGMQPVPQWAQWAQYFMQQPPAMPPATAFTMPGNVNPYQALAMLQSGQQLGVQAQLAQLQSGLYQARLTAPGTPTIQSTGTTPKAAGGSAMSKLALIASDPALQAQMGPYGPAIAAGAQGAALLASDPQVQKAFRGAGRDVKRATRSIANSKPVRALAKFFGIK